MKRLLALGQSSALGYLALSYGALIFYPDPLFAFSQRAGKIVVSSDLPIPRVGGERFLRDCERLLERSPLKAEGPEYRVYVTNAAWRQRLYFLPNRDSWGLAYSYPLGDHAFLTGANFETGRIVHWGYVGSPPRTLAFVCAHETRRQIHHR